jgi:hypothetical protein
MAGGHGWGGASQRVFQPPGAGLAPALPLLISGGEFLAHTYDATYSSALSIRPAQLISHHYFLETRRSTG